VSRSELRGLESLVIDGNNLLHRLAGGVDEAGQRRTFAQLRDALADTRTTVILDGHRARGTRPLERLSANFEVRHAGGSADEAIVALLETLPIGMLARTVVVTDDRALADRARRGGADTRRLAWLTDMLAPERRPPPPTAPAGDDNEDVDRRAWQPGRHATRKKGNPRRAARTRHRRPHGN
jgi:hypothetical protein